MSQEKWESFFKPEVQKNGEDLVAENAVVLTVTSDTAINGFVRGGGNSKVSFTSRSIGDSLFYASCTCSRAEKGNFCKHMWAVLKMTETKHPDFLDSKNEIEMAAAKTEAKASPFKEKQDAYKKMQSEKLKLRNKEIRLAKKNLNKKSSKHVVTYSDEVKEALKFFDTNGFKFEIPVDGFALKEARKTLSRVFHPDKGGTHEESLLLNEHFDVLMQYVED